MSQKTYLEQYPPIFLRNYYREKLLNNEASWFLAEYNTGVNFPPLHKQGWRYYYPIPDFVYNYFLLLALGSEIVEQILEKTQRNSPIFSKNKRPLLCSLMERDFHRVIVPLAITAWLTIDDFRWHNHLRGVPRDLNYGLVSKYPEAICAYAGFIGGFNRSQFFNQLSPFTISKCELLAVKEVSRQTGKPYKINQSRHQNKIKKN
jgi:hypothetical protein